jgi:hypothetical protein
LWAGALFHARVWITSGTRLCIGMDIEAPAVVPSIGDAYGTAVCGAHRP